MVKKINSCVFISDNGSNLEALIKSSREYNFPIKIELIISNNIKAKGFKIAKKYGIRSFFFSSNNGKKFERNCLSEIKKKKIKLICLAGFMKMLSNNFIKSFGCNIINIHPSLLPKFKGLNTHKRVLENKEKYSGCTVHLVAPKLDSGKIIMQKKILIKEEDNEETLKKKVLRQEHIIYSNAIRKLFKSNFI